jgi:protein-L-isoaspartate(D-aspartate) O-methyltransferase
MMGAMNDAGDARSRASSDGRSEARSARVRLATKVGLELGPLDPRHVAALLEVPRDRFVRPEDLAKSWEDVPLPLDETGHATISAPHAYLLSFRLLELAPGDRLVELGSGTGYGAALGAFIVGPRGSVRTFEIDPSLAARARELLGDLPNVTVEHADAVRSAPLWAGANKIVCTFAIERLPDAWLAAIPEAGVLAAPVGARDRDQRLVRVERRYGDLVMSEHGLVRYVANRSAL